MRNLVVCCDGTWNTPEDKHDGVPVPTNVVRLYNALAEANDDGVAQLKYYHPGVGTDGTWWDKIAGGGMGIGLDKNVQSAYRWLCASYRPKDRIFLFGFSRGAFTVRSLAGMIGRCGLLDLSGQEEKAAWARVRDAYDKGYREQADSAKWRKDWPVHSSDGKDADVHVFFVGVWDTVGALGVPDDMAILNLIDDPKRYAFHDTTLSNKVEHARHAIALDEKRASFTPTLWTQTQGHSDVAQVWFPGVHSDVGGGYPETGLSDGALIWMMQEAGKHKLRFRDGLDQQIRPDPWAVLHDSRTGPFQYLRTQPRAVPYIVGSPAPKDLHRSTLDRHGNPPITQGPYRPSKVLKQGEREQVAVFAREPWNETGIYLDAGARYKFEASGEWLDRNIPCGPGGTSDGKFKAGEVVHLAGTLWGKIESTFKKIAQQDAIDFRGTKREERMPWFALVGVVANGGNPKHDGTPEPHETFLIGDGCEFPAKAGQPLAKSGYLYCYANDAWHFYDNNRGSVALTVTRIA